MIGRADQGDERYGEPPFVPQVAQAVTRCLSRPDRGRRRRACGREIIDLMLGGPMFNARLVLLIRTGCPSFPLSFFSCRWSATGRGRGRRFGHGSRGTRGPGRPGGGRGIQKDRRRRSYGLRRTVGEVFQRGIVREGPAAVDGPALLLKPGRSSRVLAEAETTGGPRTSGLAVGASRATGRCSGADRSWTRCCGICGTRNPLKRLAIVRHDLKRTHTKVKFLHNACILSRTDASIHEARTTFIAPLRATDRSRR